MTHPFAEQSLREKLNKILEQARHRGMDAAEATIYLETGFAVSARHSEVETVEYHKSRTLHVTVYHDQRSGSAATSDLNTEALLAAVDKACAIARYSGQDPYTGLAEKQFMAWTPIDLRLYNHWDITPVEAIDMAVHCDTVAREQDPRITTAEGSHVSTYDSFKVYGNTHGFINAYAQSMQTISCNLVAQSGNKKQQEHEYTIARSAADLTDPVMIAKQAAQKVLQRLESRKIPTGRYPVIFQAPIARGLLGHFVSAASGRNIYQKSSFLLDQLNKKIFPDFVRIYQQPHLIRGIGSAPFDQEGVRTQDMDYVTAGILQSYILGSYSARKLNMQTTGNAGGVFNLTITHDDIDLLTLMKKMNKGLLITDLMGQGINIVTGDYSRGAAGFWVENGEIQYPVDEITIAGKLQDMFVGIIAVANDVDSRGSVHSGSILINEMTVSGD